MRKILVCLLGAICTFILTSQTAYAVASCSKVFLIGAERFRPLETIKELSVMSYNLQSFYAPHPVTPESAHLPSHIHTKPETSIKEISQIIRETDADIVVVQEVESLSSLEYLSEQPNLLERYTPLLVPGNDHIHIGFLVKSDLPLKFTLESHKQTETTDPIDPSQHITIFSRDLPALVVRKENSETPLMVVFGNHAKSKRDRPGDPESFQLRTRQYEVAAEIIQTYQTKYGKEVPIILAGDFNTNVQEGAELAPVQRLLESAFKVAEQKESSDNLITHTFHPREASTKYTQMDDIMISREAKAKVKTAFVYDYKDSDGHPLPPAKTYEERAKQPSDHRPIWARIQLDNFFLNPSSP